MTVRPPSAKPTRRLRCLPAAAAALGVLSFGAAHAAGEKAPASPEGVARLTPVEVTGRWEEAAAPRPSRRSGRQVDDSPAGTLEDVAAQMANVSTTYGLTIRGISPFGPNGGNSRTATVVVDGVPQDNYGQEVGGLSVWDADSVEVLRGPQSTLAGRHTLAGAVVVKTRDPTDQWEGRGRASLSDPRGRNLAVAGGGPLAGGALAWRLSAEDQRGTDGARNPTRGDNRWDRDDRRTLRAKLRLAPQGTDYRALLTLSDATRSEGSVWVESTLRPASDRVALADAPSWSRNRLGTVALAQTFQGAGVDWALSSSRGRLSDRRADDFDGTELRQGTSTGRHDDGFVSHELRGRFDRALGGGRLGGVFGAYWARRKVDADSVTALPLAYALTELGLCADRVRCDAAYPDDMVSRIDTVDLAITHRALFAELDYRVGALGVVAGLRRDRESQRRMIGNATFGNSAAASSLIDQLQAGGALSPDGRRSRDPEFGAWLPKLGLSYRFDPRWTAAFTAQRGYRAGGVNFNTQLGPQTFDSEYTRNYELSLAGRLGEGLSLTVNAYRIDWRRQQVDVGTNDLSVLIVNAGRSRLQGGELELRGRAHRQLEIFAAVGASRTRFLEFASVSGDFAGKEFTLSPRQTWSLGGTWKPAPAWSLHAHVTHEGRTFGNPANDPARSNPARTLLNGKLTFAQGPRARWFLAGLNLLDEEFTVRRQDTVPGRQVAQLGRGRTLRAGLEAEF